MDQQDDPASESMAVARRHVQALTECGLPPEALLRALLEQYDGRGQVPANDGISFNHSSSSTHTPRLSVSTTSTTSTGRGSFMSTASTASSVSSHASLIPLVQVTTPPPKSQPSTRAYWCLECDTKFARKFDWKRHEDEFHERHKKYPCPETGCNRIFWGSNTFNQHHKTKHGCRTCPHADKVIRYTKKKRAWGCGFCAAFLPSMDRYYDHVALHFENGRTKAHWSQSNVIYGLLHQPCVYEAWKALRVSKYGHLPKEQQPSFGWLPKITGRTQGYIENESPGQLQDLLEFFDPNRGSAQAMAQLALEKAYIETNNLQLPVPAKPHRNRLQTPHQPAPQQNYPDTQAIDYSSSYKDAWAEFENNLEMSRKNFDPSALPQPLFSQPLQLGQAHLTGPTGMAGMVPRHSVGALSLISEEEIVPTTVSNTFEDWTSLASTMVDESSAHRFSNSQSGSWQHNPFGSPGFNG